MIPKNAKFVGLFKLFFLLSLVNNFLTMVATTNFISRNTFTSLYCYIWNIIVWYLCEDIIIFNIHFL